VLSNPEVFVEHDRILGSVGTHETTVGLGVSLGLGGRWFLVKDAAKERLSAARSEAAASSFHEALSFREAFTTAVIDRARADALEEQQRDLDSLVEAIQGLTRGGEAAGYDLLRQKNQSQLHRRLSRSAQARAAASQRLLEFWNGSPVTLPTVSLESLGGGKEILLLASNGAATPGDLANVRALAATARAAGLEARAARRRAVPDLGLVFGYRNVTAVAAGQGEVGHGIRIGITLPLTFFDHGQGEAARAEAERRVAETTARRLERESSARAEAALERLRLLEEGSGELAETEASASVLRNKAKQLYVAGELGITELLVAYQTAAQARLERIGAAEEAAQARLALMAARGTQFDAALDRACDKP
jgi:cobalt-zinc-cadmium efflux system outer membrane protein